MSRAAPRLQCHGTARGTMWNGMDAYLESNRARTTGGFLVCFFFSPLSFAVEKNREMGHQVRSGISEKRLRAKDGGM